MASMRAAKLAASTLLGASALALLNNPLPSFHGNRQIGSSFCALYEDTRRFLGSTPDTPPDPSIAAEKLRERFAVGDYYVWLYQDKNGLPTSWEKYSITESKDGVVIIEMSTKFSEADTFSTHHRMTVDMAHHLESHNNRSDWKLGFEYRTPAGVDEDDDEWTTFGSGDNVQAFEEKFDAFSMLNMTDCSARTCPRMVRVGLDENIVTLIRTARHDYTGTWYWHAPNEHMLSGVAVSKQFKEHSFSLIKSGRGSQQMDIHIHGDV